MRKILCLALEIGATVFQAAKTEQKHELIELNIIEL